MMWMPPESGFISTAPLPRAGLFPHAGSARHMGQLYLRQAPGAHDAATLVRLVGPEDWTTG